MSYAGTAFKDFWTGKDMRLIELIGGRENVIIQGNLGFEDYLCG